MNIGIVVGEFNSDMTGKMLEIAQQKVTENEGEVTHIIKVPGVFDIPLAVKKLLEQDDVDGVACLAVVIQGKTDHDVVITESTTHRMSELSLAYNKPVSSGIIGPRVTRDHALDRVQGYAERAIDSLISVRKAIYRYG